MKKHQPTNMEILKESGKTIADTLKNFGKGFFKPVLEINTSPYIIATIFRKNFLSESEDELLCGMSKATDTYSGSVGWVSGIVTGATGIWLQTHYLPTYLSDKGYLELFELGGIVLATNLLSAGYELYRNSKNKLIEKTSLESKTKI